MDRMQDMESVEDMDDGWGKEGGYCIFFEMVGVDLEKGVVIPFASHMLSLTYPLVRLTKSC